ncbi:hypothetical protein D3C78_1428680 [compost metagenome]
MDDVLAFELQIEVHGIPAGYVELRVGQYPAARGLGCPGLGLGGAEHGREIGQPQLLGAHMAHQTGPGLGRGIGQAALQVAAAHLAAEILVLPDGFVRREIADQLAACLKRRRVG